MKRIAMLLLLLWITVLTACTKPYHRDDFLGKNSAEIMAQYGDFDCVTMPPSDDGLFRNCRCGYTVKESQRGLFGRSEEQLFFISFDENGIATACETGFRPGG